MGTTLIFLASAKVVKKNPCLDKIWRKGKVKGAKFTYRVGGRGPFFSGVEGNLSFFGGKGGWISFRYKGV